MTDPVQDHPCATHPGFNVYSNGTTYCWTCDTDNTELPDAMRRLMRAAFPKDGRAGVTVPPEDLRAVLQLVKRLKNRTPADGCVVCRHKDREHGSDRCRTCDDHGLMPCTAFVPVTDVPFDAGGA